MNEIEKPLEYYKNLWEEKFREGNFPEAMEITGKASRLYPERYEPLYSYIDCCNAVLKTYPGNMELYYLLAMCFLRLGKCDSAAIVAKEALKYNQKYVKFYNLMGYLAIIDLDQEKAVSIYKKLMEVAPEEENNACFNIGFSYFSCGKIEEAEKVWRELLKKYPDDRRILYSLDLLEKYKEKAE